MDEETKRLYFLVVDDDGQVRHILLEYLKSFGFENMLQAKDGLSALKHVQNHQQRIDFIISDWEMPQVDGLTLLKAVRNDPLRADLKFIMVSSQSSRERMKISKAAKARVDAYVVKPFRAKVLQEKIQTLLNGEIDPSVAEFEGLLQEVPSNQQIQEKKNHGKVKVKNEKKLPSVLSSLKRLAKDGPTKVDKSKVTVIEDELTVGSVTTTEEDRDELRKMSVDMVIAMAKNHIEAKHYDKAMRLCIDAHFIYTSSPHILYQLACAYHLAGDDESALIQLKKVIKLDSFHTAAQTLLAEIAETKKVG
jgi:two-component system chemotaxis response regulator CheY